MSYKRERKPSMTLQEFEEANSDYLQDRWAEDHPDLAYLINDWELQRYYDDINWDDLTITMVELYTDYIWR